MAYVCLSLLGLALALACGGGEDRPNGANESDRITVSIAVLDDANRRAVLYAIEQGIVSSDSVDVALSYLSRSAIGDAASTKQYDAIEVSPLVPARSSAGFDYMILSSGLQNVDGTYLIVRADSTLVNPSDLLGKRVGVPSLEGTASLETRYVLQEMYGLEVRFLLGGDVTIAELPGASLAEQLEAGDVDAIVMSDLGAFGLAGDDHFRVLTRITDEMRAITGAPVLISILVTYPDVASERPEALDELNRMLAASAAYLRANQESVIGAVANERETAEYLAWWWERHEAPLGDRSTETQERLLDVWHAAVALGDIREFPELADVLFVPELLDE